MFRIRRVVDATNQRDRDAIAQAEAILSSQFPDARREDIADLGEKLTNPFLVRFRAVLLVADDRQGRVLGLALVLHEPELHFLFLDWLSTARGLTGGGVGGALYEGVRELAKELRTTGVFLECPPDDTPAPGDAEAPSYRQAGARLRFYERFGARPIVGTDYEKPAPGFEENAPFLVYDGLGRSRPPRRDQARRIVRAILERKYAHLCPPAYVERVVASFRDDPVRLRHPRYSRPRPPPASSPDGVAPIALVVNEGHEIHHVRERGYVEAPARVGVILRSLEKLDCFQRLPARRYGERHLRAIHAGDFVTYLRRVCANVEPGKSLYPYVFPIRNGARPPRELPIRAGYYCIDTFTPLNRNAYLAARGAVNCALTAAEAVLQGKHTLAYALVRPPGHHAEHRAFGGFCYFNSAAAAAHRLSAEGRVALLDVDYHHGNGSQEIFYERADVLTVSIHGHPRFAYPYFSGFEDERGRGVGAGANLNLPLAETVDGAAYAEALQRALRAVRRFRPAYLVVALGLDTARGDPTGSWTLSARDFEANGAAIAALGLPTVVVQEGGYDTRQLGQNAQAFFSGLWAAANHRAG